MVKFTKRREKGRSPREDVLIHAAVMRELLAYTMAIVLAAIFVGTSSARLTPTREWLKEARCIHRHESTNWHATTTWTGAPSNDHGGLQIDVGTWRSMLERHARETRGYPRDPAWATPWQQYQVSFLIWLENGHRFGGHQWYYSARACGVE